MNLLLPSVYNQSQSERTKDAFPLRMPSVSFWRWAHNEKEITHAEQLSGDIEWDRKNKYAHIYRFEGHKNGKETGVAPRTRSSRAVCQLLHLIVQAQAHTVNSAE